MKRILIFFIFFSVVLNFSVTGFTLDPPPSAPVITSVHPSSGSIGSSITIAGTDFDVVAAKNVIYFGGVKAIVTAATTTSLTVTVPKGAGYCPVTLTTGGLTCYSSQPFNVTFPGASPAFASTILTEKSELIIKNSSNYHPRGVLSADLDDDGKLDLVIFGGSANIWIYKNTGDVNQPYGATPTIILESTNCQYVVMGDFNGDGQIDLAASSNDTNTISIFRNTGGDSMSFAGKVDITSVIKTLDLKTNDLDGDGKIDLVVVGGFSNNFAYVLRNTGTTSSISFSSPAPFITGTAPTSVSIGDVTNDGKPDMVTVNYTGATVSVLKNTGSSGSITFSAKVDFFIGGYPSSVVIGDFNSDNKLDLAVGNVGFKHFGPPGQSISVLENTTSGGSVSFATEKMFSAEHQPSNLIVSDIDGDAKPDLAVYHGYYSSLISLYKNTTNEDSISFAAKTDFWIGNEPTSFTFSDWNGDGKPDLAISSAYPSVMSFLRNRMNEPVLRRYKIVSGELSYNVELSGAGFTGATGVKFANTSAISFTVVSDTLIKARVPANIWGMISVTTAYGTATLAGFTNLPAPVITSFTPVGASGTSVNIMGTNFSAATNVSFGGIAASSFSVISPTSITALVGSGASGSVSVTTPAGTSTLAGFSFIPVPLITAAGQTTFSSGESVVLTTHNEIGYSYQWMKDGVDISNATSATFTATQSGSYSVKVSKNQVSQSSAAIEVVVAFTLPSTNFTLINSSALCKGAANGSIEITAVQQLNYIAKITATEGINTFYPFTNTLDIGNLAAGTYNVCITVEGQALFQQCFTAVITEPNDLTVYASVNKQENNVVLSLSGAVIYNINLNGATYTTSESEFTLPLVNGYNTIVVTTDKLCQGTREKQIELSKDHQLYPNPVISGVNLNLGKEIIQDAVIKIYALDGRTVYSTMYTNISGVVQLDLSILKADWYILKLSIGNKETTFRIVKL